MPTKYTKKMLEIRRAKKKALRKKSVTHEHVVHVGDLVRFNYGGDLVSGKVVESRGRIGLHGRVLYRISMSNMESSEPMNIELPANQIHVIKKASTLRKKSAHTVHRIRSAGKNIYGKMKVLGAEL
jgi:hypothetical protein